MLGEDVDLAWENGDAIVMARVMIDVSNVATALTQARTSTITGRITRKASGQQVGSDITLVVATTIYDTLQTGSIWSLDSTGFNFKYRIDGATYFEEPEIYVFAAKIVLGGASVGTVMVKRTIDARDVEGF